MTAIEFKETRQRLGLSRIEVASIFKMSLRAVVAWETESGQNARKIPGCMEVALSLYEKLPKGKRPL